jgi:two-component system response regulator VicR
MKVALVVDDEPLVAMMVASALGDAGYSVIEAYDGRHALEILASTRVDVIVTDYMMPRLNGVDLALEIRQRHGPDAIPVVLVSAVPDDVVERHPGVFAAFFQKPYDIDEVAAALDRLLQDKG